MAEQDEVVWLHAQVQVTIVELAQSARIAGGGVARAGRVRGARARRSARAGNGASAPIASGACARPRGCARTSSSTRRWWRSCSPFSSASRGWSPGCAISKRAGCDERRAFDARAGNHHRGVLDMNPLRTVVIVVVVLLGAAAAYYFWPGNPPPPPPPPPPPVVQPTPPPPPPAEAPTHYEIEQPSAVEPKPLPVAQGQRRGTARGRHLGRGQGRLPPLLQSRGDRAAHRGHRRQPAAQDLRAAPEPGEAGGRADAHHRRRGQLRHRPGERGALHAVRAHRRAPGREEGGRALRPLLSAVPAGLRGAGLPERLLQRPPGAGDRPPARHARRAGAHQARGSARALPVRGPGPRVALGGTEAAAAHGRRQCREGEGEAARGARRAGALPGRQE